MTRPIAIAASIGRVTQKVLRYPSQIATEFGAYAMFPKVSRVSPWAKFVIVYQPRTGSNLLCNLLASHPHIHCDGEVLERVSRLLFPYFYLDCRRACFNQQVYGAKVSLYQITTRHKLEASEFLHNLHRREWKFIRVTRRNLVRQAISFLIAKQRGVWYDGNADPLQGTSFRLDPAALLRRILTQADDLRSEEAILARLPHCTVTYEDDLLNAGDHQSTADRLYAFLGLPPLTAEQVGPAPLRTVLPCASVHWSAVRLCALVLAVRLCALVS